MATTTPFPASFSTSARRPVAARATRPGARRAIAQPDRLTRRGKAVLTLGAAVACLGLLQVTGGVQAVASGLSDGPATASIVVQQGETLWDIAKRVAPDADPRVTVTVIRELNGLGGKAAVKAGQGLVVPR